MNDTNRASVQMADPNRAETMAEVLCWQATHRPDHRAFVLLERGEREAGSSTYGELHQRAGVIARFVRDQGLVGKCVILAYPTCIEFVAALFGCFYAGATAVPAPIEKHRRNAARLQAITADAGAAAVFSLSSMLFADHESAGTAEPPPFLHLRCVATDELVDGMAWTPSSFPEPGAVALLQYTSGSTGSPRGVMLTHSNVIHNQRALSEVLGSNAADIGVNWLPLYHDMGLIGGVLHTIYFGGFTVLIPPLAFVQKPMRWLQAIDRHRASISMGPAFAYDLVSQQGRKGSPVEMDLSSWRVAICGGEAIRPQKLERFATTFAANKFSASALMPAYGLAEATLIASASPAGTGLLVHDPALVHARRLSVCGVAVKGQRLAIVDPTSRRPVPRGSSGEIWLQGPSVAAGYWNRPDDTLAAFGASMDGEDDEAWLRTGDLGFMSVSGLVVTGRAKEIIVVRGANFDPLDLEAVACGCDAALDAGGGAAFSVDHDDGELLVVLYEVERDAVKDVDANLLAGRVIEAINRHFGLRLHDFVLLQPRTLPRTTSGKIQRHACKAQYLAGQLATVGQIEHSALGRCRPGPVAPL